MCCSDPDADVLARADADVQVATIWRPCDVTNNIMVLISLLKEGKGRGQLGFAARKASSRRLRVVAGKFAGKAKFPLNVTAKFHIVFFQGVSFFTT